MSDPFKAGEVGSDLGQQRGDDGWLVDEDLDVAGTSRMLFAMNPLAPGHRVVVSALGDDPMQSIDTNASLVPMAAPDPATLSPRDLIIAVRSAAVGWVDLLMTSGQYQHIPKPPYTPGLEYAGVVAWRGAAVADFSVGDAVVVDAFLAGPRSLGAYQAYGGFASYAVAPVDAVQPIPGALSFDQACNLLGNYETA